MAAGIAASSRGGGGRSLFAESDKEMCVLNENANSPHHVFDAEAYRRLTESFFDPKLWIGLMDAKGVDAYTLYKSIPIYQRIISSMSMSSSYRSKYLARLRKLSVILRKQIAEYEQ